MSKIQVETVDKALKEIFEFSVEKKRKFLETVELQISLKNYDPNKSKRLNGLIVLPHVPKENYKICVIADQKDLDKCKKVGVDTRTQEELKLMKKNNKLVKKMAKGYDAFLSSNSLLRKLTRIIGSGLNKAGKFPSALLPQEDLEAKMQQIKATAKFALKSKKTMCICLPIGNVGMAQGDVSENIFVSVNFLVSLLPKNWQQIKRVYIKSTMGPSKRIYGL